MKITLNVLLVLTFACETANASTTSFAYRQAAMGVRAPIVESPAAPAEPVVPDGNPPANASFATWVNSSPVCGTCVVLSNSNLTARVQYANSSYGQVRGDVYQSTGKWYWELKIDTNTATTPGFLIGVKGSASSETAHPGDDTDGIAYATTLTMRDGTWVSGYYANRTNTLYGSRYFPGDVIGVALDLDNSAITFYKNGVSQGTITGLTAGQKTPAFSMWSSPGYNSITANFGQAPFIFPAPAGFNKGLWH